MEIRIEENRIKENSAPYRKTIVDVLKGRIEICSREDLIPLRPAEKDEK